ncbi:integrase [Draconibacterium sediminis]|uniref:Integrase n=1 Tax=Draconibacterium sediminis TaxID=1544798 RepID=A0A0D8J7R3_9BACT|nr:integrase [Draconibacterium sediminis]
MFGISRQAVYQLEQRRRQREKEFSQIKPLLREMRMKMPRLGTRKLYYLLKNDFDSLHIKIGRDALFDYLRAENLLIRPKKNYTKTTQSKHWLHKHPNLVQGLVPQRAEQVFVSDITYIKSRERTHYLSSVTDAFSRKIMGYQVSNNLSTEHMLSALKMAIGNRNTKLPLIHHSDRGLQYCAAIYQDQLRKHSITPSMTDGYDCYQNALAERINGILKQEFLITTCNNRKELELLVKESVETYNGERPHLSLKMKTPNLVHEKTVEASFNGFMKYL